MKFRTKTALGGLELFWRICTFNCVLSSMFAFLYDHHIDLPLSMNFYDCTRRTSASQVLMGLSIFGLRHVLKRSIIGLCWLSWQTMWCAVWGLIIGVALWKMKMSQFLTYHSRWVLRQVIKASVSIFVKCIRWMGKEKLSMDRVTRTWYGPWLPLPGSFVGCARSISQLFGDIILVVSPFAKGFGKLVVPGQLPISLCT